MSQQQRRIAGNRESETSNDFVLSSRESYLQKDVYVKQRIIVHK